MALRFWAALFLVGAAAYPVSRVIFKSWWDEGYLMAKAVGLCLTTYIVYLLASLRILPFSPGTIAVAVAAVFVLGIFLNRTRSVKADRAAHAGNGVRWRHFFFAEAFTISALLFWTWIKAHEPSIQALEKFMDYGFTKSILDSAYFPPPDIWYAGGTINYYYFGHVVMALLTRLSGLPLSVTFNLMLATLFSLTLTMSFSTGLEVFRRLQVKSGRSSSSQSVTGRTLIAGALVGFLTTMAGNMQTIYAFTRGYTGEDVKPFWELLWGIGEFWRKLPEGLDRYWYANATRFIPFTIHEFPGYSFVVSDVHGHVLSLPFALLAIAMLLTLFAFDREKPHPLRDTVSFYFPYTFYGLLVAVLFMTNALDGPIYAGLFSVLLLFDPSAYPAWSIDWALEKGYRFIGLLVAGPAVLPFVLHFKSFVSQIAVNCPPAGLANSTFGIFLFESVEKCQKSPFWMLYLLWGFFWITGIWFLVKKIRFRKDTFPFVSIQGTQIEKVLTVFFVYSVLLVLFAEFFYFKDIYPAHFRSNTMFKLGYQAFLMFSLIAGVTVVGTISHGREYLNGLPQGILRTLFAIILIPHLFLVSIFPVFAIRSYFNGLKVYEEIDGLGWLSAQYPDDFAAIGWFNRQIAAGTLSAREGGGTPVILEADGDSYTNYARMSVFTGLPTVIGWPVHEWLWRGTYDIVAPRREDVSRIYNDSDVEFTRKLLYRYGVSYVVVGTLERERYPSLNEQKFLTLGEPVFSSGETSIYRIF